MPNIGSLLVLDITRGVTGAILAEVAFSFIGIGIKVPDVSLGVLIGQATSQVSTFPWMFWVPLTVMFLLTGSLAMMNDGLRDAFDPSSSSVGRSHGRKARTAHRADKEDRQMSNEITTGQPDPPGHQPSACTSQGCTRPPDAVLSVRDLNVRFNSENGVVHAVRGVDFDLMPGKTLGIVGESGSGKSVTSLAIMGLLPPRRRSPAPSGSRARNCWASATRPCAGYRGNDLAMVFQDPLSSLTPVYTVGTQIIEALTIHNPTMSKQAKEARAVELLALVGIPSPKDRLKAFPHEFSGGMRQRVMIAIAHRQQPARSDRG